MAGPAQAGQAVQRTRGADQVTDLFAETGRRFELVTGAREVSGGCGRPGPGLQEVGLVKEIRGEIEGIQRCERLGRPAGLSGDRQCLHGDATRPSGADGRDRAAERGCKTQ